MIPHKRYHLYTEIRTFLFFLLIKPSRTTRNHLSSIMMIPQQTSAPICSQKQKNFASTLNRQHIWKDSITVHTCWIFNSFHPLCCHWQSIKTQWNSHISSSYPIQIFNPVDPTKWTTSLMEAFLVHSITWISPIQDLPIFQIRQESTTHFLPTLVIY